MKRIIVNWWSQIPPISTKQRHLPLTTTTYVDGNPSPALGQAQL